MSSLKTVYGGWKQTGHLDLEMIRHLNVKDLRLGLTFEQELHPNMREVFLLLVQGYCYINLPDMASVLIEGLNKVNRNYLFLKNYLVKPEKPFNQLSEEEKKVFCSYPDLIFSLKEKEEIKNYLEFLPKGSLIPRQMKHAFMLIQPDSCPLVFTDLVRDIFFGKGLFSSKENFCSEWFPSKELFQSNIILYAEILTGLADAAAMKIGSEVIPVSPVLKKTILSIVEDFCSEEIGDGTFWFLIKNISEVRLDKLNQDMIVKIIVELADPKFVRVNYFVMPLVADYLDLKAYEGDLFELLDNNLFIILRHHDIFEMGLFNRDEGQNLEEYREWLRSLPLFVYEEKKPLLNEEEDYIKGEKIKEGAFYRTCPSNHNLYESSYIQLCIGTEEENSDPKNIKCGLCRRSIIDQIYLNISKGRVEEMMK